MTDDGPVMQRVCALLATAAGRTMLEADVKAKLGFSGVARAPHRVRVRLRISCAEPDVKAQLGFSAWACPPARAARRACHAHGRPC